MARYQPVVFLFWNIKVFLLLLLLTLLYYPSRTHLSFDLLNFNVQQVPSFNFDHYFLHP